MCSFVRAEPSDLGCGALEIWPLGATRNDSRSTPLRPPRSTPGSRALTRPASRRSKVRSSGMVSENCALGRESGRRAYQTRSALLVAVRRPTTTGWKFSENEVRTVDSSQDGAELSQSADWLCKHLSFLCKSAP